MDARGQQQASEQHHALTYQDTRQAACCGSTNITGHGTHKHVPHASATANLCSMICRRCRRQWPAAAGGWPSCQHPVFSSRYQRWGAGHRPLPPVSISIVVCHTPKASRVQCSRSWKQSCVASALDVLMAVVYGCLVLVGHLAPTTGLEYWSAVGNAIMPAQQQCLAGELA